MPTTIKGVTLSDALLAAAAIAPAARTMVWCFEMRHESLLTPFRWCNNKVSFTGTLEAGAPVGAGTAVVFLPLPTSAQRGGESEEAAPETRFGASNVSGLFGEALRAARGSLAPWTITERLYASDAPTVLAQSPPSSYTMTSVDISAIEAMVAADFGDPGNVAFPKLTFKREEYSGLA